MTQNLMPKQLLAAVENDLSDLKALDICSLNVTELTPIMDYMVIATGNSSRHVKSICENLTHKMKERGIPLCGLEGDEDDEWILVDLGDIVVHIMQAQTRDFYNLEKLWSNESTQPVHKRALAIG